MAFKLACGDVMPGCASRFEADTKEELMEKVASHAQADHEISEITPEIAAEVQSKIQTA